MKKLIPFFIALSLATSVYSQSNFELGLETGPNISTIYGNSFITSNNNPKIAFYAGIGLQYNISNHLAFRTGIGFERKGTTYERDIFDSTNAKIGELNYFSNFNYLTLPLLLRYSIGQKTKFFINAGSSLGFMVSQKEVSDARPTFSKSEFSNYDIFNKLDVGFVSGIGVSQPVSNALKLSIELRNNLGLLAVNDYVIIGNDDFKFNSLNALLSASYSLGTEKTKSFVTPRF